MNKYGQKVRRNAYIYNPPRKLDVRKYIGTKDHYSQRGYGSSLVPGLYKGEETYKNLLEFVKGNKKVQTNTHSRYKKTFGTKFDNFHRESVVQNDLKKDSITDTDSVWLTLDQK